MSTKEFAECSVKELQRDFFSEYLAAQPEGRYLHYKYGLAAIAGAIVLFQYRGVVVASATFTGRKPFAKPDKRGFKGALYFDPKSVRIFDPISPEAMHKIWPDFDRFSYVKHKLDPKRYQKFEARLKNVRAPKA